MTKHWQTQQERLQGLQVLLEEAKLVEFWLPLLRSLHARPAL